MKTAGRACENSEETKTWKQRRKLLEHPRPAVFIHLALNLLVNNIRCQHNTYLVIPTCLPDLLLMDCPSLPYSIHHDAPTPHTPRPCTRPEYVTLPSPALPDTSHVNCPPRPQTHLLGCIHTPCPSHSIPGLSISSSAFLPLPASGAMTGSHACTPRWEEPRPSSSAAGERDVLLDPGKKPDF